MQTIVRLAAGIAATLALAGVGACQKEDSDPAASSAATTAPPVERKTDFAQIMRGQRLFEANCAVCHGVQAQGAPHWRTRDADGKFPPPPLNGTGHAWHHPLSALRHVIANGSPGGQGDMPAWKGRLSAQQIDDVIAWFQSTWPDQAYQAWAEIDRRSRAARR